MLRPATRLRRLAFVSALAISAAGCNAGEAIIQPTIDIAGAYVATTFKVTPTGKPAIDVLARGGSMTIAIATDNTTTGSLVIPQDVFGSAVNASMAGVAFKSGYSVGFHQTADTFVRTFGWLAGGGTIATDTNDGSARIEIVLTRNGV
ncbi:MAG: hypothetical protein ABI601_06140 [bacterium]